VPGTRRHVGLAGDSGYKGPVELRKDVKNTSVLVLGAGLSSCQLAACRLVQARQPVTGIVVIDIPAVLEINNLSGLIEFKR